MKGVDWISRSSEFSWNKNKDLMVENSVTLPQNLKSFEEYMEVKQISSRKSITQGKYRWSSASRQPIFENNRIVSGSERQQFREDLRNSMPNKMWSSKNSHQWKYQNTYETNSLHFSPMSSQNSIKKAVISPQRIKFKAPQFCKSPNVDPIHVQKYFKNSQNKPNF